MSVFLVSSAGWTAAEVGGVLTFSGLIGIMAHGALSLGLVAVSLIKGARLDLLTDHLSHAAEPPFAAGGLLAELLAILLEEPREVVVGVWREARTSPRSARLAKA